MSVLQGVLDNDHATFGSSTVRSQTVLIALATFLVPVAAVVALRWDEVKELNELDPATAPGEVLFFTSPG